MDLKNEIKTYLKKIQKNYGGRCISTDDEGYINVNIVFINSDNREDETQFDIRPANLDYATGKCPELVELWKEFCKENGFKQNSVQRIYIPGLE